MLGMFAIVANRGNYCQKYQLILKCRKLFELVVGHSSLRNGTPESASVK